MKGGSAKVEGAFDVAGSGSSCSGAIKIAVPTASPSTWRRRDEGDFHARPEGPRGNLLEQTFDVDGMRVALDHFTFASKHDEATAPDWNASIAFPKGHLVLGRPLPSAGAWSFAQQLAPRRGVPLGRTKPLKGWKKKLVTVGEIKGEAAAVPLGGTLEVDDFVVGWSGTEIKARLRTTPQGPRGKALVHVGILKAGISLEGKERDLNLSGPRTGSRNAESPRVGR